MRTGSLHSDGHVPVRHSDGHGSKCSCRWLAQALHLRPDAIRFGYCQAVLMKHWTMQCDHFGPPPAAPVDTRGKWHDLGAIDGVKALLMLNDPSTR